MKEEFKQSKSKLQALKSKRGKRLGEDELEELDSEMEKQQDIHAELEERIKEAEDLEKEKAAALAKAKPSRKLIERAISQCSRTYRRQCEKQRMHELYCIFGAINQTVLTNI